MYDQVLYFNERRVVKYQIGTIDSIIYHQTTLYYYFLAFNARIFASFLTECKTKIEGPQHKFENTKTRQKQNSKTLRIIYLSRIEIFHINTI